MDLTSEEVRAVVRDEQAHIVKTLDRLAVSMEAMAGFMVEAKASERANEQKFIRVHERIDDHDKRVNDQNSAIIKLSTEVIPQIEQEVAKNTLSANVFWRFIFMIVVPLCSGLGAVLYIFRQSQETQMKAVLEAIKMIAKTAGG